VRDQAQEEAQRVSGWDDAEPESRCVRRAFGAINLDGASEATKHYVERTLLSYRLAGVDKDEATRNHLHQLHEKATRLSLEFSRNIQEGAKTVEATRTNWTGCRRIIWRGIRRTAMGILC
jgi:thimet oligopeptidase